MGQLGHLCAVYCFEFSAGVLRDVGDESAQVEEVSGKISWLGQKREKLKGSFLVLLLSVRM